MKKIGLTAEAIKLLEKAKEDEAKKKLDGRDEHLYSKNRLVELDVVQQKKRINKT